MNLEKILKAMDKLEDELFGTEEEDYEDGADQDNYSCAEWTRGNVSELFSIIRELVNELKVEQKNFDLLEKSVDQSYDSEKIFNRFYRLRDSQ